MIELSRVNIMPEDMVLPHQGHLEATLHIMSYLSLHHNSMLRMDSTYPNTDRIQYPVCDWSEFCCHIEEQIPPNALEAIGKVVDLLMFVSSDHAGDQRM